MLVLFSKQLVSFTLYYGFFRFTHLYKLFPIFRFDIRVLPKWSQSFLDIISLTLLFWVLHALAVVFMTCLNPNGFFSGGNSRKGCTYVSNNDYFCWTLRDLNPGITRDSLCLAMRPASARNLNFCLLSVGSPHRSISVTIIMSFSHFVDVLGFFCRPSVPSYRNSSWLE